MYDKSLETVAVTGIQRNCHDSLIFPQQRKYRGNREKLANRGNNERIEMALSDTKLRTLKPASKVFSESDGGGLYIEVMPTGKRRWGLKYRTLTGKQETIRLGDYPAYSLGEARAWRDDCKALVERGLSPMALKRGDPIPEDAAPTASTRSQCPRRGSCGSPSHRAL